MLGVRKTLFFSSLQQRPDIVYTVGFGSRTDGRTEEQAGRWGCRGDNHHQFALGRSGFIQLLCIVIFQLGDNCIRKVRSFWYPYRI